MLHCSRRLTNEEEPWDHRIVHREVGEVMGHTISFWGRGWLSWNVKHNLITKLIYSEQQATGPVSSAVLESLYFQMLSWGLCFFYLVVKTVMILNFCLSGEIALCAGSRCSIQNKELRKEGTGTGVGTSWGPKLQTNKKKKSKRFLTQEAFFFFCKYHAKQAAGESLKRTPINNRKDTPSVPVRRLRAQGRKGNQNAFWRFKIFGTLVITLLLLFVTVH